jgi:hypothetical protein
MRVMLTGMTSQHASPSSAVRAMNFTGLLKRALAGAGASVNQCEPSVAWRESDFDEYDAVVVGVSPVLSLAANRAYGALNVIHWLWGSGKLSLYIDAPDSMKVMSSLKAVSTRPDQLVKSFFSYRREYLSARSKEVRDVLSAAVEQLSTEPWPSLAVPSLPWHDEKTSPHSRLASAASPSKLSYVNPDAWLEPLNVPSGPKKRRWAADDIKNGWYNRQDISWPLEPLMGSKWVNDANSWHVMEHSAGMLVPPSRGGTEWSTKWRMALLAGSAVCSDWRETKRIGDVWGVLPAHVESLSPAGRADLAAEQLSAYAAQAPSREEVVSDVLSAFSLEP